MHTVTIGFHDVVEDLRMAQPIAPGHTILYTVDREQLRFHLEAIRRAAGPEAVVRADLGGLAGRVALTFDDGAEVRTRASRRSWNRSAGAAISSSRQTGSAAPRFWTGARSAN